MRTMRKSIEYLTRLAMRHSGIMRKLLCGGGRVGLATQRAARKAARFVTGKCGCFTATALVMTANGVVPIVDIEEGQQIFSAFDDSLAEEYLRRGQKLIGDDERLIAHLI